MPVPPPEPEGGGGLSADYIAALGKVTATGYNAFPTMFDPASSAWDDDGWVQTRFTAGNVATYRGLGAGALVSQDGLADQFGYLSWNVGVDAVADAPGTNMSYTASAYAAHDGTDAATEVSLTGNFAGDPMGIATLHTGADGSYLKVLGGTGQTAALLDLRDSANLSILSVAPDGKVGGVAPSDGWSIKWNAGLGQWVAAA